MMIIYVGLIMSNLSVFVESRFKYCFFARLLLSQHLPLTQHLSLTPVSGVRCRVAIVRCPVCENLPLVTPPHKLEILLLSKSPCAQAPREHHHTNLENLPHRMPAKYFQRSEYSMTAKNQNVRIGRMAFHHLVDIVVLASPSSSCLVRVCV